jgi:hypothetical protein
MHANAVGQSIRVYSAGLRALTCDIPRVSQLQFHYIQADLSACVGRGGREGVASTLWSGMSDVSPSVWSLFGAPRGNIVWATGAIKLRDKQL